MLASIFARPVAHPGRALATVLIGLFALLLAACDKASDGTAPAKGATLSVVATTGMIADLAERIGGSRVTVRAIMGEGVDPHQYKASPRDVRMLQDADLVLYNGLHLEGRMQEVLEGLASRKRVAQVTSTIPASSLRNPPEFEGQHDPHVWFDVSLWMKAAERVRDALIEADAAGKADYESRCAAYLEELRTLHAWVGARMGTIPRESRVLVTAHDAFGYFGRAYDIEVMGIQGISTDSEAGVGSINALVDVLVNRKVRAVFIETIVPEKTIRALVEGAKSRGHDVRIGGTLYSDSMGKPGTPEGTYVGMVRANVRVIVEALGGKPDA